MRRTPLLPAALLLPFIAACAHAVKGVGGSGGTGGSSTSSTTSANVTGSPASGTGVTSGTTAPATCAGTNGLTGCCDGTVLYYCDKTMAVKMKDCAALSNVCGWNATKSYYGCVGGTSMADPSGKYPIQCGK